ncbi:hypothetical protein G6F65_020780 [Rhizopus arrhizus]|nr:hypothetical protein G6F65_020780 [Rhizopus arrhizus]
MLRRIEQPVGGRLLDDPAQVHHRHAVGHVAHDRQVVADEHVRQAEFLLQVAHQVQDLRLHRHVQRGSGFVADQELGFSCQGARDRNALALAARQLQAAFTDAGAVAVRQRHDEVVDVGRAGRGAHLFVRGVGASQPQVVVDRAVEQRDVLAD